MEAKTLTQLYQTMLRIRMVEEKIAELYPEQEMRCPVHLSVGQEAVATGACAALTRNDNVFSTHRAHAHYLAQGGDLDAMLGELYGRVTGCCQGKGGSMHLIDLSVGFLGAVPIVGSTIPIAVGAAFGDKLQDKSKVTLVFFGEGSTEEGVFHESINFAMLHNLPIVFLCENNLFSVYSPLSVRQPAIREVYEVAKGHGIETYQGDGNNVVEIFTAVKKAVDKARDGNGPTFLEFETYRWREHCGPYYDNDLGYRTEDEFLRWKERDPVALFKQQLETDRLLNTDDNNTLIKRLDVEITEAFVKAKASPYPEKELLMSDIYA